MKSRKFFWKDKTGRGFTNTLTSDDVLKMEDCEDWNGESLHEFVSEAEVGDKWESRESEFICIE